MSTTDELLEEMLEDAEEYATPVTDDDLQFWIDEHMRVISIPKNGVVAGVEGDKNVNKIKFGMNRYYHGFDMSTFSGRILYSNAKGNKNYYNITDMQANGNTITFSWLVDADAVQYMGKTAFVVYLFKTQGSELRQKFYSTLATLKVLEGMEVDSAVPVEKQTDIIERMKEEISAYAEEVKKSLPADYTAMTEQVSSLKKIISSLGGLTDKSVFYNHISDITYEGEPTDEEIEGDTGKTIVNLFDKETMVFEGALSNNRFEPYLATGGNSQCRYAKIPVEAGKTYSMQTGNDTLNISSGGIGSVQFRDSDGTGMYRAIFDSGVNTNTIGTIYDANGNTVSGDDLGIINREDNNGIGITFSVPEGCAYIWVTVASNNSLNISLLDTFMIEEGTACHDYVPYVSSDNSSSDTTIPDVTTQGNLEGCEISHIFKASLKDTYARKNLARLQAQVKDFTGGSSFDETMISRGYRKFGYTIEPKNNDIPIVYANGDSFSEMDSSKNEVQMSFKYISKTKVFGGWMKIKWQGNLSINFAKHNFTVKLYADKDLKRKMKVDLRGWGEQNKFVWKANFVDRSHARNIVSARLWSDIVASRPTINSKKMSSPNKGAVDGFPFILYVNGEYYGLMTWNIPKDGWMANMSEDNPNHCILCSELNGSTGTTSCDFNAPFNETAWSVEFPDEISNGLIYSFNDIISCVQNDSDEDFKNNIGNHLDIYSFLDYYSFFYLNGGTDSIGKNMLLITYDGTQWILDGYDMDGTWGRDWNGKVLSSELSCPEGYQNTNSLLWKRVEECFPQELHDRYFELRETILSKEYIMAKFEQFVNQISEEMYTEDHEKNGMYGVSGQTFLSELSAWLDKRFAYCDSEFKGFNNL